MRKLIVVLLFCVSALASFAAVSCASEEKDKKEKYKTTDLPFEAVVSIDKGGEYSETMTKNGPQPICSGISIKSLKLGTHEIPLKASAVSSECFIETKDYGKLLIKINFASYSSSILVTPKQEALFKKLVSKSRKVSHN